MYIWIKKNSIQIIYFYQKVQYESKYALQTFELWNTNLSYDIKDLFYYNYISK